MTLAHAKLQKLLDPINKDESPFAPRCNFGHQGDGAINIGAIESLQLSKMFALATARYKNADVKMGAAFCLGQLSWSMLRPLAGYAINGIWINSCDLSAFEFSDREVPWQNDSESGSYRTIDVAIDLNRTDWVVMDSNQVTIEQFSSTIEALFAPLVEIHHSASGLAKPALWRLIGDSLAAAFLNQGGKFGCRIQAMKIADQIVKTKGTKLFSKQAEFIEIKLPERPDISEWFRKRGGCCRYYTADGGEYCSTCVLRDDDSRNERLETYVRNKVLGEAAA